MNTKFWPKYTKREDILGYVSMWEDNIKTGLS
jgi:hypothetical protein